MLALGLRLFEFPQRFIFGSDQVRDIFVAQEALKHGTVPLTGAFSSAGPFVFGLTLAITVLVIACPHALGLAIPTVTTIATTLAVRNGLFVKNLRKLEVIKDIDCVVFDKTGTLTQGKFGVTKVIAKAEEEKKVLQIAATLEAHSTHVIGFSILAYTKEQKITPPKARGF